MAGFESGVFTVAPEADDERTHDERYMNDIDMRMGAVATLRNTRALTARGGRSTLGAATRVERNGEGNWQSWGERLCLQACWWLKY